MTFQLVVSLAARRIIGFTAHCAVPGADIMIAACRAAAKWPDGIALGVELSAAQWQSPTIGLRIFTALNETGLSPARLELEIAEPELANAPEALEAVIRARQSGILVALTGCGQRAETAAPIDYFDSIKFAGSVVRRLGHHAESDVIADSMIRIADHYGLIAVADGISTDKQLEILKAKGCVVGQGSLFGKPVRASEIAALLRMPSIVAA
ncbi:MAG: EAL domain-containing protein [Pseudolabrys sp.]